MDQMIAETETTVSVREFVASLAPLVIVGIYAHYARKNHRQLKKALKKQQPIMSYTEFLESRDEMSRFYTNPTEN